VTLGRAVRLHAVGEFVHRDEPVTGAGRVVAGPYSLPVPRAELDKQPTDVRRMFDAVARRYDVTNDVLSMGQDRRWRRSVIAAVDPRPGELVLDLAAGTGTSSQPFADRGAAVVPCDFSLGMLRVGKEARPHLPFTAGDGTRLPFADDTFDAVTISFGLRNIVDPLAGLAEMRRVTRPGGRIVVCEFSHPTWTPFRTVYLEYLMKALPPIARAVSSAPDAYVYLAESIRAWPDQQGLAAMVAEAGWQRPAWQNLSGGIVALHRATK
jgi:demethylmenaquinone methyltransferase/2-methoxy-6-polyprenyl-1,4-benzoquinol methylase